MLNEKILIKKTFNILDGPIQLTEGEVWWGRWKYISSLDKDEELPLVVICSSNKGPYLILKENCELANQSAEINT